MLFKINTMDRFITIKRKKIESEDTSIKCIPVPENESIKCIPVPENESEDVTVSSSVKETKGKGRKFQEHWKTTYPWIKYDSNVGEKVFCSTCTTAVEKQLPAAKKTDSTTLNSIKSFVTEGYSSWSRALRSFQNHEKSSIHINSITELEELNKTSVIQRLSASKTKQMTDARIALEKFVECIAFIGREGLPFRTKDDKDSKLMHLRAKDVPELKWWLNADREGYKWLHHNYVEEFMKLQAISILEMIISEIKEAKYFSIVVDETSDVSRLEQVAICFRFVEKDKDFRVREEFIRFYQTDNTKSQTLFEIVNDVLIRLQLNIHNLRGQCFDGAANVRGYKSGLQAKILEVEPRAIFVHCAAHRLNLVVQDVITEVPAIRDFLGTVQSIIMFVKESPKRLAFFREFQGSDAPALMKFCPTRWSVRIKSLRAIFSNYEALIKFFTATVEDKDVDLHATSVANGFIRKMESFEFFIILNMIINVFEKIEILNTALQNSQLSVNKSHEKVEFIVTSLQEQRNEKTFSELWKKCEKTATDLNLDDPVLPKPKKIPRKRDNGNPSHQFSSPEDLYRVLYFQIVDLSLNALNERFEKHTTEFYDNMENFLLKKDCKIEDIISFYNINDEEELNESDLVLHRDMLQNSFCREMGKAPNTVTEVIEFLKTHSCIAEMLPEVTKFVGLLLTIPATSCSAEWSFSALRRLKTYLRATMKAERLNHVAILNIHSDYLLRVDDKKIINEWILRNVHRTTTFLIK